MFQARLVLTEDELLSIDPENTDFLLGLLGGSHIAYFDERTPGIDPVLVDMTEKAIEVRTLVISVTKNFQ